MNAFIRRQMTLRLNEFLTERCTLRRRERRTDNYGGAETVWVDVASNVPCRVITDSQRRHEMGLQGKQDTMPDVVRLVVKREGYTLDVGYLVEIENTGLQYEVLEIRDGLTDGLDSSLWIKRYRGED